MNNFLLKITGNDSRNKEIQNAFIHCSENSDNSRVETKKQPETKEEKQIYFVSDNYVNQYIIPFLIKKTTGNRYGEVEVEVEGEGEGEDEEKEVKQVPDFCYISNKIEISEEAESNSSCCEILHLEFYSSCVYFEDIENADYEMKRNKKNKNYKSYIIDNKDVLLLHGEVYYKEEKKTTYKTDAKELYYRLKDKENESLNECFQNMEGTFALIYVKIKNGKMNLYLLNDTCGTKSFLFLNGHTFFVITNTIGFFVHYSFNYIALNNTTFIFNDASVNEEMNLVNCDCLSNENNEKEIKATNEDNLFFLSRKEKSVNDVVASNIIPYYIFNLLLTHNSTCLKLIKKENCIYTKENLWKRGKMSIKADFQNVLKFFEMNELFSCFNDEERLQLQEKISEALEEDHENEMNTGIKEARKSRSSLLEFHETKLNNIFICLFMMLLNEEVKKKIQSVFSYSSISCNGANAISNFSEQRSLAILFSGGIDSTLLSIITIHNFFVICENGYIELINVVFDDNAVDRYTSLISYEHIINLFPYFDIRLIFIDVSVKDVLEKEKLIFSLISPNTTIMDFNISSALFFANVGKGYICPKLFLKSRRWKTIKKKVFNFLDVRFDHKKDIEEKSPSCNMNDTKIDSEREETSKDKSRETRIKKSMKQNKCRVCEHVKNKKCTHQCCSSCCRKLRYVYCELYGSEKNIETRGCLTGVDKANRKTTKEEEEEEEGEEEEEEEWKKRNLTKKHNSRFFKGSYYLEKNKFSTNGDLNTALDIYEVKRDTQLNILYVYLFIKKKKILIDFEISPKCSIHRDKIYDYKKISTLFFEFNEELRRRRNRKYKTQTRMKKEYGYGYGYEDGNEIKHKEVTEEKQNREECTSNYDKSNLYHIILRNTETLRNTGETKNMLINLFAPKKKKMKENNHYMGNSGKDFLNFLKRELYATDDKKEDAACPLYTCKHEMLIIGSGADEFYGGYFRQNQKSRIKEYEQLKMKEMEKDIKRLWLRNLYRDDRILSFTSKTEKCIFYPYLNLRLADFLFSISFHFIHFPLTISSEQKERKEDSKEVRDEKFEENSGQEQEQRKRINLENNNLTEEIKMLLLRYEDVDIDVDGDLSECKSIYQLIKKKKISKWILRMCLFFLNSKEVMFFKKKAIQFGSKSKNIRKYVNCSFNISGDENALHNEKRCIKGDDAYILFS